MAAAPKVRVDLEYFDKVIEGEEVVVVHDPVRNSWFRFNLLQAAMLRALDGKRSTEQIAIDLSVEFDVEIPPEQTERFVIRARDLMLLELASYQSTPARARKHVRKALRKAGFRLRAPDAQRTQPVSQETEMFAEAFRQLDLGHPRAAAGYLTKILAANPNNARARQLYEIVQTAFMKSHGRTTDYPTFVLFNPSKLLDWLSRRVGRVLFSWLGIVILVLMTAGGLYASTLIEWKGLSFGAFDILCAYFFVTAGNMFHEAGHGFVCQHYGGHVTEIGYTLFYYFRMVPYCDTSSSYLITDRKHKMMVQLGGSLASIFWFSGTSIFLALLAPTVPIYSGLAISLVLGAAFSFVGLIPLLKNDGYYALADYVNIPNLRERSIRLARAWLARSLFGLESKTETVAPRTRRRMIAYGIAARLFTMSFVLFVYLRFIVTPLIENFRALGLGISLALTLYLFRNIALRPVFVAIGTLIRERRRVFTLRRLAVLVVLVAIVVGPWFAIQWPVLVDSEFVVMPRERADVRARTTGRVATILVKEGDHVAAGQALAVLENPQLLARAKVLEAERQIAVQRLAQLQVGARPEELAVAQARTQRTRSEANVQSNATARARRLAKARLGTQSSADSAGGKMATELGEAGAAKAELSLLEAGARPEAIKAAEAERARIDGELEHVRSEITLLTLTSPIAGIVTTPHLDTKLQATLALGEVFAEVHDTGALYAELPLRESDPLSELAIGDEVVLKPYGDPGAEVRTRIVRFRETVQREKGKSAVVAVTSTFAMPRAITGLNGHARIYGAERSLAYANFVIPIQRIVNVQIWAM